jgi:hypothetical protein
MSTLQANIAAKLAAISENFQRRASSWLVKATEVFTGGIPALVAAVGGLVAAINAELRKIVQSFRISITTVLNGTPTGSTGTSSTSTLGGSDNTPGSGTVDGKHVGGGGRASGGPVIGGQGYNVSEFFRPERFTPAVSGRIDPIDSLRPQLQPVVVANWNDFPVSYLATEIVKAQNNR